MVERGGSKSEGAKETQSERAATEPHGNLHCQELGKNMKLLLMLLMILIVASEEDKIGN